MLRRRDPSVARALLTRLLDDPAYEWLDASVELIAEALPRWLERFGDQRFSLTDAVSVEVMRRLKLRTAFAFDDHFAIVGFERLV